MKNLFWFALAGAAFWAYSTGQLDSWITQYELADRPIAEVECEDLVIVAKGQSLRNAFGATYRVLQVSSPRLTNRTSSQLTCRAEALLDDGRETRLTVRLKERGGERFYEFSTN